MPTGVIPLHPQAVTGDPQTVDWIVPREALPVTGRVLAAPGAFGDLLAESATAVVEPGTVRVTLAPGHTWRHDGPAVRDALAAALERPREWRIDAEPPAPDGSADRPELDPAADADLAVAVAAALAGPAGEYVRAHGGRIALVGVEDGQVEVTLSGACATCPGASGTLTHEVERVLRQACPAVVAVRRVEGPRRLGGFFPTIGRRRA